MKRFALPSDTAVVTTSLVTVERRPILLVFHDEDEEDAAGLWQFHSGDGDYSPDKLQLVALGLIIQLDPSVQEVADLPPGWSARRGDAGDSWELSATE